MASFYDRFRRAMDNIQENADMAARLESGKNIRNKSNRIIDALQYAEDWEDADFGESFQKKNNIRKEAQYTPFAWSGDTGGNMKGLVVSDPVNGKILGIELSDGRSLNRTGAKKFFDAYRNKGGFYFADSAGLENTKEKTEWPLQPGNPLYEYKSYGNAPNMSEQKTGDKAIEYTFRDSPKNNFSHRSQALEFFKNLRGNR